MAGHTSSPEARNRAVAKYVKNNYDLFQCKFTKESGLKEKIAEHIKKTGESMNAFLIRAAMEVMENDNKKTQ